MAGSTEIQQPGGGEPRSLAHSINTAIVLSHNRINRLILDRMPHAVPPQVDNPSAYITGLLHIGAVYIAFESLWQNIIGVHTEIAPLPYIYPFRNESNNSSPGLNHGQTPPRVAGRTRHILETAYWPNMLRAARVKADVRAMTGWPAHVVDEQLRSAGTTGELGAFTAHIEEAVGRRPHLLLAYAYSLYLALLSGGSYIRTELMYLRPEFWLAVPDPIRPGMVPCTRGVGGEPERLRRHSTFECGSGSHGLAGDDPSVTLPLSFLDFDTPLGHENPRQQAKDLKAEFKRRFADAEQALTEPERRDIVAESVAIFDHLESVVGQLDKICGSGAAAPRRGPSGTRRPTRPDPQPAGIGSRLRDSIAVAKGRLLRTMRRSSGAGGPATATTPSATKNATASPPGISEGSTASSVSPGGLPRRSAQGDEPEAQLDVARGAAVPGEGFRTIRYGGGNSQLDAGVDSTRIRFGGHDGTADEDQGSAGWNAQACPMSRAPTACAPPGSRCPGTPTLMVASTERRPDYTLYAVVSNAALLLGVALAFAAYLYVRSATTTVPAGGGMGKDW